MVVLVIALSLVLTNSLQAKEGLYEHTWNSLSAYNAPEWLKDAKFGIYTPYE